MRRSTSLASRTHSGQLHARATTFSTGFLMPTDSGTHPVNDETVIDAALKILSKRIVRQNAMENPRDAHHFLAGRLGHLEHEVFAMVLLDTRHRVLDYVELFRGTIDGSSVHPREVCKTALAHNAAAVLLAHNHPSGICTPSQADELITRRLIEALRLLDIRVLDHIIVAGGQTLSFAEKGLL